MSTAVLLSGGLDSAVLLAEESRRPGPDPVRPIYVSVGLSWETAELSRLDQLVTSEPLRGRVGPIVSLTLDMRDVYPVGHWAVVGEAPAYHTPDEDVYLPGRNITLLGKAGIFCSTAGIDRLVLGTLDHNPFPDATDAFRSAMADALSLGLAHRLTIEAPYARVSKADVIRRGTALGVPLQLTLSCMKPVGNTVRESQTVRDAGNTAGVQRVEFLHCGVCSKCRERHDAFIEARIADPTDYADRRYMGTS